MTKITVRGHEFNMVEAKDSFDRRAVQYRNNIIAILKKLDLTENDMNVDLMPYAFKKAKARAEWRLDGSKMAFEYDSSGKFVDNLYVVQRIIELEVNSVISGEKDKADFIKEFLESENPQDALNPNKHQSENSSDRQKFMKMTGAHKLVIRDQE